MKSRYTNIYQIADIRFCVDTPWEEISSKEFLPFLCEGGQYDWKIEFKQTEFIQTDLKKLVFQNDAFSVYRESESVYIRQYHNNSPCKKPHAAARVDTKERCVLVEYLPEGRDLLGSDKKDFFNIAFEKLLIEDSAMILHAACVDTRYGGILFSGDSGAGKSTQAELWCQYGEGRLINGDRPILKHTDGGWRAYGSPYAGSSRCHLAESCFVKAIVIPKKADRCSIRRLSGVELFRQLYGNLTVNVWDESFVTRTQEMTMQLMREVPVYEMECTKDKESVFELQKVLGKGCEQWISLQ